ncbi:hypothetical protein PG990_013006 [Apiospora arundinis]
MRTVQVLLQAVCIANDLILCEIHASFVLGPMQYLRDAAARGDLDAASTMCAEGVYKYGEGADGPGDSALRRNPPRRSVKPKVTEDSDDDGADETVHKTPVAATSNAR